MISLALDSGRNFKQSFRLFSGHFLQTLNWKRPGTGRILPRNFRPESAAKELAESDRNLLNSTGTDWNYAETGSDSNGSGRRNNRPAFLSQIQLLNM
ncbi:unnamed protein product [Adineta ricciae]|uniref:Uncharacterized protein n=1 Tax=Adineta ricciae TaxID=249248 RepID=A0A815V966_ADIRI|nr:unnamed protein product [Adineta ricciae]